MPPKTKIDQFFKPTSEKQSKQKQSEDKIVEEEFKVHIYEN